MRLTEIGIQGYKSLADVRLTNLGNLVCLVGRNNSGKSAILEVLWSLRTLGSGVAWADATSRVTDRSVDGIIAAQLTIQLDDIERRALAEELLVEIMFNGIPFASTEAAGLVTTGFARSLQVKAALSPSGVLLTWLPGVWTPYRLSVTDPRGRESWLLAGLDREPLGRPLPNDRLVLHKPLSMVAAVRGAGTLDRYLSDVPPGRLFDIHAGDPGQRQVLGWVPTLTRLARALLSVASDRQPRDEGDTGKAVLELAADASNLPQVLQTLRGGSNDLFEQVVARVREVFPDTALIQTPLHPEAERRFHVTIRWAARQFDERLSQVGSGVAHVLIAALLAATAERGRILLIEEPELHLHPGAQRALIRLLREVSERNQVILTTHSPHIVGALEPHEIILLGLDEGRSTVTLGAGPGVRMRIADDLGILPHEGLLRPCVVLVDGPSDADILSTWFATLHADGVLPQSEEDAGVGFVPLRGERNFKWFMGSKTFTQLGIQFVLVQDRDSQGDASFKAEAEAWVTAHGGRVHRWRRREIENYFHPDAISRALRVRLASVGPDEDIKDLLTRALKGIHGPLAQYYADKNGAEIAKAMTAAEIREMDRFQDGATERHEIVGFLSKLALQGKPR